MKDFFGFTIRRVRRKRSIASKKEYEQYKEQARALVHERLAYFNQYYNFSYNKVFIKNTKTRWGSCSSKKNLNFSYKIATLPPVLADYLVVHELCHLQEFHHKESFWALVAQQIPDYKERMVQLRAISL